MEKLLVKIFDRKKWIVNQAKQQTLLFEQHLASKCLIDGIVPPPWLCSSTDPNNVLNKQELNSGVPLPRALPVIPFSSHCSVFDKPAPTTLTGELPNGLCTELHVLDKGFGAGDKALVLPQCSVSNAGYVSNDVPHGKREEDPSVTSPGDVRDARITDIYHDLALSPTRGAGDGLPQCPVSSAGCSSNGVPQDQRKEDLGNTSPEDQRDTRTSDIYHDPALSLARVQRSKPRQKALEIRNSAIKTFSQEKNNGIGHANGTIGCAISYLQSDHVDELNLVKPPDTSDYACEVEEANIGEFQSKERGTTIYSGRITRSRSSGHPESSLNVSGSVCIDRKFGGALSDTIGISPQQSKHVNKSLELVNYSHITNESCQENEAKVGEHFIKEKGSSIYSGRTTRSRSASEEPNCLDELSKLEQTSNSISEVGVRNSLQQPKHVDEVVEVVKSCDIVDGSCEVKTKVGECWSKVTSDYSGRITRSRSSSQKPNDVNNYPKVDTSCISVKGDGGTVHHSTGKSTQPPQPLSTGSQAVHSTEKIAKDAIINISGQRINQSTFSSSNKSHDSQRTQISAARSLPIQCDIDLCAENSTDSSDKENDADYYAGRKTSAETNCTTEGMSKPVNSQTLVHRGTQSRFAASKKHLSEKMTRGSAGIRHQDVSSTMVKEVPCTQNSEFVKAAAGGETEIDPEVSIKGSGSKLDGTGLRVEVEVLASREPADCNEFVNPKQLNFDDVEESCRNGSYTPAFKEGMQGRSSEKRSISLMDADDILEEGMTVDYQENHNLSLPMKFLGDPEVSVKGKDLLCGLSGSPAEEDRSVSNGNAVSSVKETSDVHNDAVANMLLESGNRESQCGTMGSVEHSPKAILESQGLSLSQVDVATSIVSRSPVEETPQNEDHHMIESPESSPKAQIKEGEYSDELNIVKPPDTSPCEVEEGKIGEFQSKERGLVLFSGRITKSRRSGQQESSLNVSGSASNARRTDSVGVSPRLSNPANQPSELVNYSHITNDCFQKKEAKARDHFITEGSCPQHKRRKIECKTTDDQSASLGLREQGFYNVNRDSMCGKLGSVEDSPKAVLESQGLSISREDESIFSRSSVEETHQNEDHHVIEWSESSPKAQMTEGRISLGCRDTSGSAPFIFMDKEFEASILSLMKQTGMMEETGLAHPPSIIIDSVSQCMVETTVSLTRKDNLTTGNAEHLTCAGRAMQEMRFDLGGTTNFGSPHGQSLDLIGSDDRKPELDGFVMQTDDEPTSIAGKGISFDEWNLPSTTIEHASILEHLCQSACMQTPVVCSSASNKLHKIPNLYQSVPTGLLEGVDMRTMNDVVKQLKDGHSYLNEEVGQAFYGRSYSDCLLNHSGQSGWDTKKPYLSPVGKLWDTTGSGTSSSRKRGSLNLELPCISEENENADEAADTFQDESVTDALNRSIQRVPLADITEIPNPPASISKAEPYADRLSLDSMNTEFSLTGTHKNFEQRLGIQSSSKRRYNNKENLSMSRGTNDIKRTTGSLHNRFNKPKLSGKTSLRKGGPSLSEQEPKRNNIVSSMTSFIPLVQQKQAAAVVTGKRDVKVKALEAAEAAKRQAEKKENERKMKKEALKLERSRMEQENMKQLDLQKKKKEEERKKKEADMASKKRQREEEERKEKERKRMRIEARRNKREHEDKVPAEKDGRGPGGKESQDEMANKKMEEEKGYDKNRNISETKPCTSRISISNAGRESIVQEEFHEAPSNYGYKAEVLSNSDRAMKNSVAITSQEQSYDISPYKESDDENDDDDSIIPNNKFIPSWSSKNCLAFAASSQNRADPETIFPPESFCCISEVLLPLKHQLNNSGMC
ncbi:hypothetical protein D8674_039058 [Pyrus ussuriensis x Pyrus communis]|uniref:Inner centromere protein ARK-binding domain-containing protein n=1 Tax=Pyrus ussuriensis x Pyrus communis TaxID=2448454 RepID=A0A5N5FLS0_9ROSA|nr:hypothetical protein D8674_039058 [Pyrus ussuriensis x Pyrus communis]